MPDAFGTWDSLTARAALTTFADAYRIPPLVARDRVARLLVTVHLEEYADRPASVLSRGQKQRLGLARALVHDPLVLLLDEMADEAVFLSRGRTVPGVGLGTATARSRSARCPAARTSPDRGRAARTSPTSSPDSGPRPLADVPTARGPAGRRTPLPRRRRERGIARSACGLAMA